VIAKDVTLAKSITEISSLWMSKYTDSSINIKITDIFSTHFAHLDLIDEFEKKIEFEQRYVVTVIEWFINVISNDTKQIWLFIEMNDTEIILYVTCLVYWIYLIEWIKM
jgi:hypothetical protein